MSGGDAGDSGGSEPGIGERLGTGLDRLVDASAKERLLLSLAALAASILVGAAIVLVSGVVASCDGGPFCYNPLAVYFYLFQGAFGSLFNVALTLKETTLLVFTGLAVAVAFKAGLFNIGTQGQLVLGALATALAVVWVGPVVPAGIVGALILVPLGLLVGAVVGAGYGAIPGALKAYADANEVITTIMLNFVATGVALYLVNTYFSPSQRVETRAVPDFARIPPLVFSDGSSFSILALVGALALVVAVFYLFANTTFGFDLRTGGIQPNAAEYGGVDAKRMTVASMALSGAIGGLGGAVWVLMVSGRWQSGIPALGFDGITVSILAGNNPIGVVPAALLFGALKSGSLAVDLQLDVPKQLVGVLRGLVILFVAMPEFFRMLGARYRDTGTRAAATDGGTTDDGRESDDAADSSAGSEGGADDA